MNDRMQRIAARAMARDLGRTISVGRLLEILDEVSGMARSGIMSAPGAVGEITERVLAEVKPSEAELAQMDAHAATERPHVTPIGGNLGVKPLGSPDPAPAKPARKSAPKLRYRFNDVSREIALTTGQRETLRIVAMVGPRHRDNICPRRVLTGSSATSLVKKGLLAKRSYPVIGYQLTAEGKAVVAALNPT